MLVALRTTTLRPIAMEPFHCPRCDQPAEADYYGPCDACRAELRATVRGEARQVAAADYEPKMNVTPNAVASKE